MHTQVYIIRALTNLHPGSGDAGYGVVDKLVQRDPTTGFPTIHMSGVKGALREYFENKFGKANAQVLRLFGSSPQAKEDKVEQGQMRFISAELLAIPGPDPGPDAYKLYCHPGVVGDFENKIGLFDPASTGIPQKSKWQSDAAKFKALSEELPVIARNYLDNGESKNLWYEEFIPREALFGCIVQGEQVDIEFFQDEVNDKVIQLGGNATVGYGYCLFQCINPLNSEA